MNLAGPRLKLARAEEHLVELENEIDRFLKGNPYQLVDKLTQMDPPQRGLAKVLFRLEVKEQPPERLGIVTGDVVHNLRSALDHTYCCLIERHGGTCGRFSPVFPICTLSGRGRGEFDDQSVKTLVGDEAFVIVEAVQPFNEAKDFNDNLLLQLRELSNTDKHRLLLLAQTTVAAAGVSFRTLSGVQTAEGEWKNPPFDTGDLIGEFVLVSDGIPGTSVEMDYKVEVTVGFGRGMGPAEGAPLKTKLRRMLEAIRLILQKLESLV